VPLALAQFGGTVWHVTPEQLKSLAAELTEQMAEKGVRKLRIESEAYGTDRGWKLELELDPAAQVIRASAEEVTRADPKPKPDGECPVVGCEKRGGHMGQRWCSGHFQAALRGQVS
jgi:hypothetical protein